ncbi:MAG: hypothetical protein MK098_09920 [Marinovum sp.]|nr:hypothetical protein [Marinovum sp.]
MPRALFAIVAVLMSLTQSAAAQDTSKLMVELNRSTDAGEGVCQVIFVGRNDLGQPFNEITLRLAVFDAEGIFQNMLALPLGQLSADHRKIARFNLPSECAAISEIVVNDVAACILPGGEDISGECLDKLEVSSRSDIAFGL